MANIVSKFNNCRRVCVAARASVVFHNGGKDVKAFSSFCFATATRVGGVGGFIGVPRRDDRARVITAASRCGARRRKHRRSTSSLSHAPTGGAGRRRVFCTPQLRTRRPEFDYTRHGWQRWHSGMPAANSELGASEFDSQPRSTSVVKGGRYQQMDYVCRLCPPRWQS